MASAISCIETCHDAFGTPDGGSGRLGRGKLYPTIYENQYPGSTLEDHQPDDTKESLHKRCNKHNTSRHGWRPVTLRIPVLASFALSSLLIAAAVELLAQISQRRGGFALSDSPKNLKEPRIFVLTLIPTIVSVVYSLCWSWIDLDVKRFQPWVELSKDDGTTAEKSLFLEYKYDLIPLAAFKSAKRRQWLVCLASIAGMINLWAITPLQAAIFETGPVNITEQVAFPYTTALIPTIDQGIVLDQSVLNAAFAVTWLHQPYPPYMTSEYALLPFSTKAPGAQDGTATNWTGTTLKLTSELDCWEPTLAPQEPLSSGLYTFDNGRGCSGRNIDGSSPQAKYPFHMLYIGYQESGWADYCLSSPTCSQNSSHQFLAYWSKLIKDKEKEVAGLFCEATYYKQKVSVTVSLPSYVPISSSLRELGPREDLPDTEFNQTAFEYLLTAGVSTVTTQRDFPSSHLIEPYPRLVDEGIDWPISTMVGFAIGSQNYSVSQYSDPSLMQKAFTAAHKTLFSLSVTKVLSNTTQSGSGELGTVHKLKYGITVNRIFSLIVESLLIFVALLSLGLLWRCAVAKSKLSKDPASIASLMGIVKDSPQFLSEFSGKGTLNDRQLRQCLKYHIFRLRCGCETQSGTMTIEVLDATETYFESVKVDIKLESESERNGAYRPLTPKILRKDVGVLFSISLMAMIASLSYLKSQEQKLGGLIRPSENSTVLQILENYIPTILATLLEPIWVVLNRFFCLLQPFQDMRDKKRQVNGSVYSKYTSIPPQLAIFKALKSRHFFLAVMCSVALLANVLAVGFSGLFNEVPTEIVYNVELKPLHSSRMNNASFTKFVAFARWSGNGYEDHMYATLANFTSNTTLPPWISTEFAFEPFQVVGSAAENTTESFQGPTRGYGFNPNCISMKPSSQPPVLDFKSFNQEHKLSGTANCSDFFRPFNKQMTPTGSGKVAIEAMTNLGQDNGTQICQKTFIAGWGRKPEQSSDAPVESSFVVCYPHFQTAMFEVKVDGSGYVKSYNRTSDFEKALDDSDSLNKTDTLVILQNNLFSTNTAPQWHNDSSTRNWIDHFMKLKLNSSVLIDPNSPVPDANKTLPLVEDIYRRTFALLIGLNMDIFEASDAATTITGSKSVIETRIFIPNAALIISLTILGIDLLAAIVFYGFATKMFLPQIPTTVGAIIAYLAPSCGVRVFDKRSRMSYGFGIFVGVDGQRHVGIELDQLVTPVKAGGSSSGTQK